MNKLKEQITIRKSVRSIDKAVLATIMNISNIRSGMGDQ